MTAMGRLSKAGVRCGSPSRRPTGPALMVRMTFLCTSGEVRRGGGMRGGGGTGGDEGDGGEGGGGGGEGGGG